MITKPYAPEADTVAIEATLEAAPGVMIDFDAKGDVVGVEVRHIRTRGQGAGAPVAAE